MAKSRGAVTPTEIPLSDQTQDMLRQLVQQQVLIQTQVQLILKTVLSCQNAEGHWVIAPCGTKLIKKGETNGPQTHNDRG